MIDTYDFLKAVAQYLRTDNMKALIRLGVTRIDDAADHVIAIADAFHEVDPQPYVPSFNYDEGDEA